MEKLWQLIDSTQFQLMATDKLLFYQKQNQLLFSEMLLKQFAIEGVGSMERQIKRFKHYWKYYIYIL
jgi:hypothetical protein